MKHFRKVPGDIEQAEYITALIDSDVKANLVPLAQSGDTARINKLTTWLGEWQGITADLKQPAAKSDKKAAQPKATEKAKS